MLTSYLDLRPPQVSLTVCLLDNFVSFLSSADFVLKSTFSGKKSSKNTFHLWRLVRV